MELEDSRSAPTREAVRALADLHQCSLPDDYVDLVTSRLPGRVNGVALHDPTDAFRLGLPHATRARHRNLVLAKAPETAERVKQTFQSRFGLVLDEANTDFVSQSPLAAVGTFPTPQGCIVIATEGCAFDYLMVVRGDPLFGIWASFDAGEVEVARSFGDWWTRIGALAPIDGE